MTTPLPVRVMALHAMAYCERLFYLEEVEEIRVADERVFAGRQLHENLEEGESWRSLELEDDDLGLVGKMDCLRKRDGLLIPYEHKRGRSMKGDAGPEAWFSDRLQILAYAMLLERESDQPVEEGRIRYHADNKLVKITLDDIARAEVREAVNRARELRLQVERPPVCKNENLCLHCSLAPVCLPEEERLAADPSWEPVRLFPPDRDGRILHVTGRGAKIGKTGDTLGIARPDAEKQTYPVEEISEVVLHGNAQITTQAIGLCRRHDIGVHWVSSSGSYTGGVQAYGSRVQRRIRQYRALCDESVAVRLARMVALAKVETQLRFSLRALRTAEKEAESDAESAVKGIRASIRSLNEAESLDDIRGYEGQAGRCYFQLFDFFLKEGLEPELRFSKRSRRPPKDRVNALLGFGYNMLFKDVLASIWIVGLEPALGFLHQPRSSAPPLALDLMELFRTLLWDMPLVASLNRRQWNVEDDFQIVPGKVWLSTSGRKKAIELYERRKLDKWKHPVIGYSLSYERMMELEVRLLEKEWSGQPGLFARMRIR